MRRPKVLLLAGTSEARRLAERLVEADTVDLIASLAGATRAPKPLPCETRIGGFGGADPMAAWFKTHRIDAVIDATHPFAAQISANVCAAAFAANVPLLRLERPAWTSSPGRAWREVADLRAAAAAAPSGARVFLTTGGSELDPFRDRSDVIWIARVLDRSRVGADPPHLRLIEGPPRQSAAEEAALMTAERATHLVTKNAGGSAARAKLDAAEALRLSIIMVARPPLPAAETVGGVDAALTWVATRFGQPVQKRDGLA